MPLYIITNLKVCFNIYEKVVVKSYNKYFWFSHTFKIPYYVIFTMNLLSNISIIYHLVLNIKIVDGIPITWTSNLRLGSTFEDALCILKLKVQPSSKNNSIVLSLPGLQTL